MNLNQKYVVMKKENTTDGWDEAEEKDKKETTMTIDTNIETEEEIVEIEIDREENVFNAVAHMTELLKNRNLLDDFVLKVRTEQGDFEFPIEFVRWEDSTQIRGISVCGAEADEDALFGYEGVAGGSAIANLMLQYWKMIDCEGLLLRKPWDDFVKSRRSRNAGWMLSNYSGDKAEYLPIVTRRVSTKAPEWNDTYKIAWAKIDKVLGEAEVTWIAAHSGRKYKTTASWKHAQRAFGMLSTTLDLFYEGSLYIALPQKLGDYYHLLFNVAQQLGIEEARKVSTIARKAKAQQERFNAHAQKTWVANQRTVKSGGAVEIPTEIGGVTLVVGKKYVVVSGDNNAQITRPFIWDPSNENAIASAQACARLAKFAGRKVVTLP